MDNDILNLKVDNWLTFCSQSEITPESNDFDMLINLMKDESPEVKDIVINTLIASANLQ